MSIQIANNPTIASVSEDIKSGKRTCVDIITGALNKADAHVRGAGNNALLEVLRPSALAQAKLIDQQIAEGKELGPLAGIPYIAKDNYVTKAGHTTAASNILEPFESPYQGTVIDRLESAGAILIAKANLDAFAHGSTTENSDFGATTNPHDSSLVPGGSSGGSAAAVALGIAPFALGTDTGGSIRLPASFCGVVGLKPSYGLVSRYGVIAMASSTDCPGPLANNVADAALVLDIITGRDPRDSTSVEKNPKGYALDKPGSLTGKTFGVVKQFMEAGIDDSVRSAIESAIETISKAGGRVVPIDMPSLDLALAVYYTIVPAEISSNLARYDGVRYGMKSSTGNLQDNYTATRTNGFGDENKRRIMIGTFVTSSGYHDAYYKRAQTVRTKLIKEFASALQDVDFLIGPVAAQTAFPLNSKKTDPLAMYLTDVMTVAPSLVGVPSLSLPLPRSVDELPVGLQIIAAQQSDRELLETAHALEEVL